MFRTLAAAALGLLALIAPATAETVAEPAMTPDRLLEILGAIDADVVRDGNRAQVTIQDLPVLVIMDPAADRMRALVPVAAASEMTADELQRVLQANFDTALDARYAIAGGRLWATYIHPLSPLERDQFLSALAQTVNLALSYGTLYSGGALAFGNGDSGDLQRQLIEDLLDRGQDI